MEPAEKIEAVKKKGRSAHKGGGETQESKEGQ